jgi:osmotically-inducible protein OsmY
MSSVYADGVYRAYDVEPYFTTNVITAADNTGRNVRDGVDRTRTPLDQGNSKADVATTARIRKEILAGKNMSVNAQNVKIVTNQGQVTLRGPVNSAEEKRLIGEIANRIARTENVDNQLEVKLTTSSNK